MFWGRASPSPLPSGPRAPICSPVTNWGQRVHLNLVVRGWFGAPGVGGVLPQP